MVKSKESKESVFTPILLLFNLLDKHLSRFDAVGRPHHALLLHLLNDAGGSVVTDAESSLHERNRGLSCLCDKGDGLVVFLVVLLLFRGLFSLLLLLFEDRSLI